MNRFDAIESAFLRVKASAGRVATGDEASKEKAYEEIFALNNEIGRLGREVPATMRRMKELQGYVNMVTVGIKYGRRGDLLEGLTVTEEAISVAKREFASSP